MTNKEHERRNENDAADPDEARRLALFTLGFISGAAKRIADDVSNGAPLTKDVIEQIDVAATAMLLLVDLWQEKAARINADTGGAG